MWKISKEKPWEKFGMKLSGNYKKNQKMLWWKSFKALKSKVLTNIKEENDGIL